jgi:hypothetical protein
MKGAEELGDRGHGLGPQRVERPTSSAAVGHEAGIAEHAEMEGEERLPQLEVGLQITDAALTVGEHVDNPKTSLISQSAEQWHEWHENHGGRHDCNVSILAYSASG